MKNEGIDYTKDEYISFWGKKGYKQDWSGYKENYSKQIFSLIDNELGIDRTKITVEIGPGAGYWTEYLVNKSKQVIALDVIEKNDTINKDVVWLQREDRQFNCAGIENDYVDFVFSFGTFCHFTRKAGLEYLIDIKRIMKPSASAIIMFSTLELVKKRMGENCTCETIGFKNMTEEMIEIMFNTCGLQYKKIIDFRDLLLLIKK